MLLVFRLKEKMELTSETRNEIEFTVFLIHRLSRAWNKTVPETYRILSESNILGEYILPCYDVLHTQGESYLINDITAFAQERGALA